MKFLQFKLVRTYYLDKSFSYVLLVTARSYRFFWAPLGEYFDLYGVIGGELN